MKETFGQRFARLRKNLGLKQDDIAEKVNISAQAVSKWENDLSAPDISTLPILADILTFSAISSCFNPKFFLNLENLCPNVSFIFYFLHFSILSL